MVNNINPTPTTPNPAAFPSTPPAPSSASALPPPNSPTPSPATSRASDDTPIDLATADLTEKQRDFIFEYLKDGNATAAARRAGYGADNADVIGPRQLKNPAIAAAIKALRRIRNQERADDLRRYDDNLKAIALFNMVDLHQPGTNRMRPLHDLPQAAQQALILRYKIDRKNPDAQPFLDQITAGDKLRALIQLIKTHSEPREKTSTNYPVTRAEWLDRHEALLDDWERLLDDEDRRKRALDDANRDLRRSALPTIPDNHADDLRKHAAVCAELHTDEATVANAIPTPSPDAPTPRPAPQRTADEIRVAEIAAEEAALIAEMDAEDAIVFDNGDPDEVATYKALIAEHDNLANPPPNADLTRGDDLARETARQAVADRIDALKDQINCKLGGAAAGGSPNERSSVAAPVKTASSVVVPPAAARAGQATSEINPNKSQPHSPATDSKKIPTNPNLTPATSAIASTPPVTTSTPDSKKIPTFPNQSAPTKNGSGPAGLPTTPTRANPVATTSEKYPNKSQPAAHPQAQTPARPAPIRPYRLPGT